VKPKTSQWSDCDFQRNEILVRGDPQTATKNWSVRTVPMIPGMRRLLERLRYERPNELSNAKVMRVSECNGSLANACRRLGIPHITHHDLRHLFATTCIESGVDIPTVSRWLGHKDGGALAMKVMGIYVINTVATWLKKFLLTPLSRLMMPGDVIVKLHCG